MTFASKWADATDSTLPPVPRRPFERASNVPSPPHRWEVPQSQTKPDSANASDVTHVAALIPAAAPASPPPGTPPLRPTFTPDSANAVPLRLLPATDETTRSPARQAAQPVTAATPQKHVMPQQAHDRSLLLPGLDGHTAVYDIAAHTVYLPNGEGLEAHSGLGSNLDDPRFVNLKNRGPTPPNVYDLALREQLFHGVRAIRLRPVGDDNMYGRDGILAHSYMLGPNGQSNGCVSFRDYPTFLRAVLRGEVDRLVVVPKLGTRPSRTAMASSGSTGSVMQRQ